MEAIRTLPSAPSAPVYGEYISVDEFWEIAQSAEYDDCEAELVEGQIVTMSKPGVLHGVVATQVGRLLDDHVTANKSGLLLNHEVGYVVERKLIGRDTMRGVDVSFISRERVPTGHSLGWSKVLPDLAVEVISPGNKTKDTELKISQLLRAGVKVVWVVYPDLRRVHIHTEFRVDKLYESDTLTGGDVLPGFEVKVADLFPS